MHLKQLANIVNGKLVGKSIDFEGFSIDTRSISNNQIYIALIGKNFDGHRFLEEAQLKGAAAVIVNKLDQLDIPQLVVDDTLCFIKEVANHNRTQYEGKMIGITGTNGKTSTKQITYSLLDNNGTCHKTTGNMNNQIGVPFSLLSLENHHHYSVIEMGTSEPGEIEVLTNHVRPDIAAITNVSMGHLEGLTDTDCIASEKGNILNFHTDLGVAFLPSDSDYLDQWKKSTNAKDILTFGFDKYSDFRVSDININVENKIFNFDNVYLSSQSLGIAAKGKINLESEILDMRGSIAPIKLISQIISVVPAVGELLTGLKKEGLFAGQFKMVGPIKKPKVKLNTLSFAPGILRDLFAEDWLNKKKFFLRNR